MSLRGIAGAGLFTLVALACGGGGGGGGTVGDTVTVGGEVYTTVNEDIFYDRSRPDAPISTAYTAKLSGANVTFCKPTSDGIRIIGGAPATRATSSGGYTLYTRTQVVEVEQNQPLFICASNPGGTYTLLGLVPPERVAGGAAITVNVSPGTTMVGWMVCPGMTFPPVKGPCYTVLQPDHDRLVTALASCYDQSKLSVERTNLDNLIFYAYAWLHAGYEYGECPTIRQAMREVADAYGQNYPAAGDFSVWNPPTLPTVPTDDDATPEPSATPTPTPAPTVAPTPTSAPTPAPDISPYMGTWSGRWNGTCPGFGPVSGRFSVDIAADGSVTGAYSGDESGSIDGAVANDGSFYAQGAAGGDITWWGDYTVTGGRVTGSGDWSEPVLSCSGVWSVP